MPRYRQGHYYGTKHMSRLHDDKDVISRLRSYELEFGKLKAAQPAGGDSWIVYRNVTAVPYDIDISLGSFAIRYYTVTFTPDDPTRLPPADLEFIDSSTGSALSRGYTMAKFNSFYQWHFVVHTNILGNSGTANIRIKFIVRSTQKGAISLEANGGSG